MSFALAAALLTQAFLACNPSSRNELSLSEKCDALEHYCEDHPQETYQRCFDIGRRGARDLDQSARCFRAYDQCIDECIANAQSRAGRAASDPPAQAESDAGSARPPSDAGPQ